MIKAVAFLQNAWSPTYCGGRWPRDSWLRALNRSRSGQRIRVMMKECESEVSVWFDNTTPIVGIAPDSVVPPDMDHMESVLRRVDPSIVIAFGKQASTAVSEITQLPTLFLPHPAFRLVTNVLFRDAGRLLAGGIRESVRLRQLRGEVQREVLVPA